MDDPENPDYVVGYGKPPKETRFKKGKSGNEKGRPKGKPNLTTVVNRALSAKVAVTENGRRHQKSKLEVSITQVINKAAAGDLKATQMMLKLLAALDQASTGETLTPDLIADREHALRIAARLAGQLSNNSKENGDE